MAKCTLSKINIELTRMILKANGAGSSDDSYPMLRFIKYNKAIDQIVEVFDKDDDILTRSPNLSDSYDMLAYYMDVLRKLCIAACEHEEFVEHFRGSVDSPVFPPHQSIYLNELWKQSARQMHLYREAITKYVANASGMYRLTAPGPRVPSL